MRPSLVTYVLAALIFSLLASHCSAALTLAPQGLTFEEAADYVRSPEQLDGNSSGVELQVYSRIGLLHVKNYVFEFADTPKWEGLLQDKSENIYARLCAAYFLLDADHDARNFVDEEMNSENLRYRYNAAEVVRLYVGDDSTKTWGIDLMIKHLADGSLEQGVRDDNWTDSMESPLDSICFALGRMRVRKAVPALMAHLERTEDRQGAVLALGEIGDPTVIPYLLKLLQAGDTYSAIALGQLKSKEAVPILISWLNANPESRKSRSAEYSLEDESILTALLSIGDARATGPIKEYLRRDHPEESKSVARRVLLQLDSADPVQGLIQLLDKAPDTWEYAKIVNDLAKYNDPRVVAKLTSISETSDSASMRQAAIKGLAQVGTKAALLEIVELLDRLFPDKLTMNFGFAKRDLSQGLTQYFHDLAAEQLQNDTHQDFGRNSAQWRHWIEASSLR